METQLYGSAVVEGYGVEFDLRSRVLEKVHRELCGCDSAWYDPPYSPLLPGWGEPHALGGRCADDFIDDVPTIATPTIVSAKAIGGE